jgi:hypothetical protein
MQIAAIAAAAATNVSTITLSPGGTPIASMGLTIGGAKPLVTFAPVLSRSLALRNTVLWEVYEGRSRPMKK